MAHIILLVLKIIGILALGLLGLLLALILLILLAPVRYRVFGEYYHSLKATCKISWLFGIVSVTALLREEVSVTARILGIPVCKPERPGKQAEEELETLTAQELSGEEKGAEALHEDGGEALRRRGGDEAPRGEGKSPVQKGGGEPYGREDNGLPGGASREKAGKLPFFQRLFQRVRQFFASCRARLRAAALKKERLEELLRNENNQKTVRLIFRQLKKLFRHLAPTRARGRVMFGFEDPYTMGQALTCAGLAYPLYHEQLEIVPVFDQALLEIEGDFRGRIRIGVLVTCALRILMDKNFRTILKKLLR